MAASAAAVTRAAFLKSSYVANMTVPKAGNASNLQQAVDAMPTSSFANTVLVLAICSSCVFVLAPLRFSFQTSNTEQSTQAITRLIPLMAIFSQCYFWTCYGCIVESHDIARFNALGASLCLAYLFVISRGSKLLVAARPYMMSLVGLIVAISLCIIKLPISSLSKAQVYAYSAMVFSFLQVLPLLVQAMEMLRSRTTPSSSSLTVNMSSFVSNLLWAEYSLLVNDHLYFLSNMLNATVGGCALAFGLVAIFLFRDGNAAFEGSPLMPRKLPLSSSSRLAFKGMDFDSYNSFSDFAPIPSSKNYSQETNHALQKQSPFGSAQGECLECEYDAESDDQNELEDWHHSSRPADEDSHISLDCVL
eukprot:TRINITY_DN3458_c0_g1_i2.p1 TRINITY_DN3458_c0_g1~~TRINITY_DN3458_c0_g1_i2.p1  ORF type:complete len:362 (-),score=45.73 TRINITY_DN3458_c0_g1_i2:99-1184(-)